MANKKTKANQKTFLAIGTIILLAYLYQSGSFGFLGAIIPQENYNGDMEQWCVNSGSGGVRAYGELADGTQCTSQNSIAIYDTYDGTHRSNTIPLYWKQAYGCCMVQSTDSYSGEYAALFHKESKDDWYGMGMTKDGSYTLPAKATVDYTLSLYYKMETHVGRDPSLSFRYYDKNGEELTRETKGFTPIDTYTYWEFTVPAPSNAVTIGWDIWFPPESEIDLLIDELRYDEAEQCEAGAVEQCGTDFGVCQFGVRTCQADGFWGTCDGGIQPGPELCDDADDNNCNGRVNEGCIHEPYTLQEYQEWFDIINTDVYDTTGYSTKDSVTWWAWDNAPIVEAQVKMYEATGDTKYLNMVVANTDLLISKASDFDNDGLLDWEALETPIDPILTYSRNLLPMIMFSYVVKRDELTIYDDKANQYIDFVEDNFIPIYDDRWAECSGLGFWREGTTHSAPNNRVSYVARIYVYLYAMTDNEVYKDKLDKFSKKFLSTLMIRTDGNNGEPFYYWNYNNAAGCITNDDGTRTCSTICPEDHDNRCLPDESSPSWSCNGDLELHYGNYDIAAVMDLYEIGAGISDQDMDLFIGTFTEGFLLSDAAVDGEVTPLLAWSARPGRSTGLTGAYSLTAGSHMWARLGQYSDEVQVPMEKIAKFVVNHGYEHDGDWYSMPYLCYDDLTDDEGELCGDSSDTHNRASPGSTLSLLANLAIGDETVKRLNAPICSVDWECTEWGAYSEATCGVRVRICTDTNDCNDISGKPQESESLECPDATCDNNNVEQGEVCDGTDLDEKQCDDIGFTSGHLSCLPDCSGWDTSKCKIESNNCISDWNCTIWSITPDESGFVYRSCADKEECKEVTTYPEIKLFIGKGSKVFPDEIAGIPSGLFLLGVLLVFFYYTSKKKPQRRSRRRKK